MSDNGLIDDRDYGRHLPDAKVRVYVGMWVETGSPAASVDAVALLCQGAIRCRYSIGGYGGHFTV